MEGEQSEAGGGLIRTPVPILLNTPDAPAETADSTALPDEARQLRVYLWPFDHLVLRDGLSREIPAA